MQLIVNGESQGQLAFTGSVSTSDSSLYIGADPTEGSGLYLPCKVDEVRIWDRACSLDQVRSMMYDTLSAVYYQNSDSGLVAYYRFDRLEDLGINNDGADDIRDFSINANHGDTHGGPALVLSDAMTGIFSENSRIPNTYRLEQNYPNPFNPTTTIGYQLSAVSYVELSIYNILGKKVATLVKGKNSAGEHSVEWNASGFASGVYVYRIVMNNGFTDTKKLLLLK